MTYQVKKPNANDLTASVVKYLNSTGWKVWRQNTTGIFDTEKQTFRKSKSTLKGVSDVIGFHKKTARFIAVEVKVGKDTTSLHQDLFLNDVRRSGGVAMVVKSIDDLINGLKSLDLA